MDLRNKKVLVIGLGKSGFAAATMANEAGARVFVTENSSGEDIKRRAQNLERNKIEVEINGHSGQFLKGIELAVISPGISQHAPFIEKEILAQGIPVISEIELAFAFCKSSKLIAVTGTNGKSTAVELIGHILKKAGREVTVCGNIGIPFSACVEKITRDAIVVLEVSSYQLEVIKDFRPYLSIILNITEDHLDRYSSMHDYALAKTRIFKNQTKEESCIINFDDQNLKTFLPHIKAGIKFFSLFNQKADCFTARNEIFLKKDAKPTSICRLDNLPFGQGHNIENTLASILAASFFFKDFGFFKKAISTFSPLHHRTEFIASIKGIDFVDDSKATNVDATRRALESLGKNIVLICGGRNKKSDFNKIKGVAADKIKLAIAIGEARGEIVNAFKGLVKTELADTLETATRLAFKGATEGDCVLLSPMCASFDMFKDYQDRGRCFRKYVLEIKKEIKCAKIG